jgi:hypothetical protein
MIPAVLPTPAALADYAFLVLRIPLIFLAAVLFSLSFGVYMIDAMGTWPRRRRPSSSLKGNGVSRGR